MAQVACDPCARYRMARGRWRGVFRATRVSKWAGVAWIRDSLLINS